MNRDSGAQGEVDISFASRRVTRLLEAIIAERGVPQAIRYDNGPELTSRQTIGQSADIRVMTEFESRAERFAGESLGRLSILILAQEVPIC